MLPSIQAPLSHYLTVTLILVLLLPVSAHEEHNARYSADDYYWGYSSAIRAGDTYSWQLKAESTGFTPLQGRIRITTHQEVADLNLLQYLTDNTSLAQFEGVLADNFEANFDQSISHMTDIYPTSYLIVPVRFSSPDQPEVNVLAEQLSRDRLYVSYINDTIDAACIQGCHVEKEAPFTTKSVDNRVSGDEFIIEGQFTVRDIPSTLYYSYERGSFQARYDVRSGLLNQWQWTSEDGYDYLSLTRKALSRMETFVVVVTSSILVLSVVVLVWILRRSG